MELERSWTQDPRPWVRFERVGVAPPGPWDDEPDKVQWIDPATDLDCLAVRNHFGNWCGYVGLPAGHPALDAELDDLQVHGGITYGPSPCMEDAEEGHGVCHVPFPGRTHDIFWVGFDCGHAWDLSPVDAGMRLREPWPEYPGMPRDTYRDLAYVRGECALLAAQLQSIALQSVANGIRGEMGLPPLDPPNIHTGMQKR